MIIHFSTRLVSTEQVCKLVPICRLAMVSLLSWPRRWNRLRLRCTRQSSWCHQTRRGCNIPWRSCRHCVPTDSWCRRCEGRLRCTRSCTGTVDMRVPVRNVLVPDMPVPSKRVCMPERRIERRPRPRNTRKWLTAKKRFVL